MAPRAAPHKRGGTHRVQDQDRTNTVYDDWDYKQLKNGCIERGIYVKDMKKVEMARALADYDIEKRRAERSALVEHEKKMRKLEAEKRQENDRRLQEEAMKHKRRMEKEARREREESVSDDTPDEDDIRQMHDMMAGSDEGPMGQVLSEESWDSTSTDTTDSSVNHTILPECKLRLFEWSYPDMPSPTARISARQAAILNRPKSPEYPPKRPLPIPRNIPYTPLKVHTTGTKEKLFLPGKTYPPGVNPDFVPLLSPRTRHAARNGVLSGVLRKATIERASTWATRTQIQGWNARIFFSLAPRNETKALSDVYTKWFLENRKLLRVEPRGAGLKISREQRHVQRQRNKGRKLAEVLEASEYRPTAVCYLPAYLDYVEEGEDEGACTERHTLENLFFVRFPGCDVPHYYFWTGEGAWADPTARNGEWVDHERPGVSRKRLPGTSRTRVKNPAIRPSPPVRLTSPPDLDTIVALIEFELYTHGLAMTLIKYRNRWAKKGKDDAWRTFGQHLPLIYPSGIFPSAPPLNAKSAISIAVKLASIEKRKLGDEGMLDSLRGDEPWTSRDDVWWSVDGVNNAPSAEPEHEALYRRGSVPTLEFLNTDRCATWLEQVSPSFVPLTPESLPDSPVLGEIEREEREGLEGRFLQDSPQLMDVTCPFCLLELRSMNMEERAEHMHAHNSFGEASHRRVSLNEFSFTVSPSARRRRCSRMNTQIDSFDAGADADNEKTPTTELPRSSPNTSSRKRKRITIATYRKKLRSGDSAR